MRERIGYLAFTAGVVALLVFSPFVLVARAQTGLEQVVFSKATNDPTAFQEADRAYKEYLDSLGVKGETADADSVYARYLPLDESKPKRFIGYYLLGRHSACPVLGCEILIFDNYQSGQQRLVMTVFAHQMWLGTPPAPGIPRDIYLRSYAQIPPGSEDPTLHLWRWNGESYEAQ